MAEPTTASVTVVVPSVGRPALARALAPVVGRLPVLVVDDRPGQPAPLEVPAGVTVLRSGGRGPAAARNTGWRACGSEWVAFLDDDVEPPPDWVDRLLADLSAAQDDVGGVQASITVPRPAARAPTDVERATIGLADADWATADLAYRRAALMAVGGFCEGFPRAYREDADLGLRVVEAGWRITTGSRHVVHPIKAGDRWTSVRAQRGNLDDVLMRRRHGPGWRSRARVPPGRRPWHLATTGALVAGPLLALSGARRTATVVGIVWVGLTADFAARRVAAGPRTRDEVLTMGVTSVVIPPVATGWWLRGWWRHRQAPRAGAGDAGDGG